MDFVIHRKAFRRGLRLSVQQGGKVCVSAPLTASTRAIVRFVEEHREWIERQVERWRVYHERHPRRTLAPGAHVLFLGLERELVFERSESMAVRIEPAEAHLVVRASKFEEGSVRQALQKFYRHQARLHLSERVLYYSQKMEVSPAGLSFRGQRTRWGSCSSRGHISLNYKTMVAPERVIDHIVVHELAHLRHHNHSAQFWSLVERFDPDFQEHRRWLKAHHHEAEFLD